MQTIFRKGGFAMANTAAVLSALYIAMAFDLERPYWAMFTVFIIAKPMSGAVRSKAIYRFAGTVAGATVAVFLVPPLVQAPVLLCVALSAWVGTCLYFSLLDRTPRSYAFMLAGYTAAIIGFSVVESPQAVCGHGRVPSRGNLRGHHLRIGRALDILCAEHRRRAR